MSTAEVSLWRRLCYTRLRDVFRGRFDASLDWRLVVADADLPAELAEVVGQTIRILSGHAITITDGTNILLNGSADFVMAAGDVLVLTMYNDQVWVEDSRQVRVQ